MGWIGVVVDFFVGDDTCGVGGGGGAGGEEGGGGRGGGGGAGERAASARVGAREGQEDKAQGTQRMQLLAVVINKEVGAPQPMAEED